MNHSIQKKLDQYKKLACQNASGQPVQPDSARVDSLSMVIRSKKDAEEFMAELEAAFKRAK